jgi:SPOR domain
MSVSGPRSADINLDEFERRLRAAGTPPNLEDPLFELARLVDGSWPEHSNSASTQQIHRDDAPPLEASSRPELENPQDFAEEPASSFEAHQNPEADAARPYVASGPSDGGRSGSWKLKASALAVVGVAMIGAVFALRGGVPGIAKQAPFIAAAQGPTKVQPPREDSVASANDAGANLLKDGAQAASVKVVASEEQPIDLNAQGSGAPANPASPTVTGSASNDNPVKGIVDAPVVVAPAATTPPVAPQFPDPKPVRTVSLRPDGTPIPPSAAAPAEGSGAAPAGDAPKPTAKPSAKMAPDAAGNAQASTPKLDLPTKLSSKSSARVVVAKTDTTALGATDAANGAVQPGTPIRSDKPAKAAKAQQTANAAATPQTVDPAPTGTSTGWAVQLAAPKSEAEAKSAVARLNAKYASALNGSAIGVHKAVVNGDTIYRLRVVGLNKADAAALCARLKGDGGDCFIAK